MDAPSVLPGGRTGTARARPSVGGRPGDPVRRLPYVPLCVASGWMAGKLMSLLCRYVRPIPRYNQLGPARLDLSKSVSDMLSYPS